MGGKTRDGQDAANAVSYMALRATEEVRTHQPGLSVRIHADCPKEFMAAVTRLVSRGTGFPAIHSDSVGYQMLLNLGYSPRTPATGATAAAWCPTPARRASGPAPPT